ncbi:Ig-like domain-containing protein [Colwellia sp. MSW7]|uniref:Ig-like domain-containing protein n=1 Tax=Colwellia maritima TaxID=2912588 RepID=A0ABS9X4U6_9GAMM|nr:Ig-like domain-containing protein [Colwellia maritima]MCI2285253.1 Ig-like domain-containing protein [Colwellia maritima]
MAPNQLQGVGAGNDLASFAIAPGRKTQVISVGSNLTTAEHYYVHVIGKGKDQECSGGGSCPGFSNTGTTAPYDTRPNLLVPFLVPLPDEDRTWIDYRTYRGLLADEAITNKPNKPLPAYSRAYRPEYQFSQYGLEMKEINATATDANGAETSTNILKSDSPTITSSDDYITALYSLISSNNDRLTAIDGPQELVLALGEEEQLITIGEDQSITFSNIAHLASLDPEDFLSMRLYTNNDASNILWEYAFGSFGVYPEVELEISADDHFTYITAMSVHGDGSDIGWKLIENSGGGNISENATELDEQVSIITLNTSTKVGDTYKVRSQLINIETQSGVKAIGSYLDTGLIKVIAGKPDTIQITKNIEHYPSDNTGTVTLTALIKDQFGNHVEDGTAVTWLANESTSSFISVENITVDGLVTAELRSPKLPVDQVVTVMSGDVVHSTTMKVNRVSGSLTSDVAVINVDNTETATITANVNATDGTPVFWMSKERCGFR